MKSNPSRLSEASAPQDDPEDPRICYCMKIPRSTLLRAIEAGSQDLEGLMRTTRAGTGCGTCRVDLIALLGDGGKGPDG
ncbi:MAG: (2Fe-2S)-binding protein [Planctomycetota bacterium]|jgi:NAD(P)H-nitrite reductase large subunit